MHPLGCGLNQGQGQGHSVLTTVVATAGCVDSMYINRNSKINRQPRVEFVCLAMCTAWRDMMIGDHAAVCYLESVVTAVDIAFNTALPRRSLQCHVHCRYSICIITDTMTLWQNASMLSTPGACGRSYVFHTPGTLLQPCPHWRP